VAGGGDGTVNQVVNGMLEAGASSGTAMAVLPLGSANDFATVLGAPIDDPLAALTLAATGEPVWIDVARVNGRHFLNAAVAGLGADVTLQTSDWMKSFIGGAAYALTGFLTALKETPFDCRLAWDGGGHEGTMIFGAVSNGREAGHFVVSPHAKLDDGRLDLMSVPDFAMELVPDILGEVLGHEAGSGSLIRRRQVGWLEMEVDHEIPLAVDGEPITARRFRFDVLTRTLPFVLPQHARDVLIG
jgi:YegS/Rv2252/BmrU family lipid kinase